MSLLKPILRRVLEAIYKVEVNGHHHLDDIGDNALFIANHTSFLDALLLAVFLPDKLTFAVNTQVANNPWLKPFLGLVKIFPMDPTNPMSLKSLVRFLKEGNKVVIFPEGRITVTGALMKIYDGTGLVADKTQATIVPVRIEGAQYTPFSRLKGRVRLRWFPSIRLSILPTTKICPPDEIRGRERRKYAGRQLADLMTEMMFATSHYKRTLFQALLDARKVHGRKKLIVEDVERKALSYHALILRSFMIGRLLQPFSSKGEVVGVLLPSTVNTVAVFTGMHATARIPAMLNYTVGANGMIKACETAGIKNIITSHRFIKLAKLEAVVEDLSGMLQLHYLEDLVKHVSMLDKMRGLIAARFAAFNYWRQCKEVSCNDPAVVLFTSGSEGTPKGVVLSHANLLANREQLAARVDFTGQDIILNALPMFHSFGLTAGTLLPLLSGMKTFFYPSPLHYRIVPEISYDINATILFGTNTFLAGYARFAHPYDFYSVRYVFAGAEKLQEETRRTWSDKFGVRIFEGYGATETSPVLAINTPMDNEPGSVGRLIPGVDYRLEDVPGVEKGGRLYVAGPNIMLGYYLHDNPGVLVPPTSRYGEGWYDTGDIVDINPNGFVRICGRAKRFAKIGGEMVSLSAAEELANASWPDDQHAVVAVPDAKKGEQLVLLTTRSNAELSDLLAYAKGLGVGEINVPRKIISTDKIPLLGTGKLDYNGVTSLVQHEMNP